jgi:type IV pilus assembly protein PilA
MLTTRSESRRHRNQSGFSLVELLVVIAIILIILFFAVPQYNKARMNAQETGAIAGLKTIYQAQIQYQSQFGDLATSLPQLGPPSAAGAAEGPQSAGLIAAGLAAGNSSGYVFTVTQTPTGYSAIAVPKTFNSTGRRTFYSDQTGVIRQNWGADPATPNSPEVR